MATETGGKPYSSGPHFDWENYFCAMSRVWKRAAKKYRKHIIEDRYFDMWIHARTDANHRLELLREANEARVGDFCGCSSCGEYPRSMGDGTFQDYHHEDCELAKELGDDTD